MTLRQLSRELARAARVFLNATSRELWTPERQALRDAVNAMPSFRCQERLPLTHAPTLSRASRKDTHSGQMDMSLLRPEPSSPAPVATRKRRDGGNDSPRPQATRRKGRGQQGQQPSRGVQRVQRPKGVNDRG